MIKEFCKFPEIAETVARGRTLHEHGTSQRAESVQDVHLMYQTFRELACRKNRDDFEHQLTRTRTLDPLIKSRRGVVIDQIKAHSDTLTLLLPLDP